MLKQKSPDRYRSITGEYRHIPQHVLYASSAVVTKSMSCRIENPRIKLFALLCDEFNAARVGPAVLNARISIQYIPVSIVDFFHFCECQILVVHRPSPFIKGNITSMYVLYVTHKTRIHM